MRLRKFSLLPIVAVDALSFAVAAKTTNPESIVEKKTFSHAHTTKWPPVLHPGGMVGNLGT